jgi:hypothetical protein
MPLILGTNSIKDTGYNVDNSLRFNRGSSDSLNKTLGTPTNVDIATFSTWIKFSDVTSSNDTAIFAATADGNNTTHLEKLGSQVFRLNMRESSSYIGVLTTNRVFRDPSAWYHIVVAFDTTQGTASNRIKLYINGVQETSFSTATYPTQNVDLRFNTSGQDFLIGNRGDTGNHPDAYFAETVFIDGQQLAADQFGEFDEDSPTIWKPKDVSGLTFGNNGFYLEFKQSGTSQNSSGLGADTSGQDNHFAVNNLTAIDQSTDTCTNNFCTLNPLQAEIDGTTLSEGNTKLVTTAQSGGPYSGNTVCTFGVSSGKWYWEAKLTTNPVATAHCVSVVGEDFQVSASNVYLTADNSASISYITFVTNSGNAATNFTGTRSSSSYGSAPSINDIVGVALDLDNGKIFFSVNGTWQNSGDPANGTNPASSSVGSLKGDFVFPAFGDENYSTSASFLLNFGSPAFSISSGNTDGNGYGNFEYAVPSGYFALNSKNLAEYG